MERLKRYNKQIVALMSALIILVGGIFSTSFQAKATSQSVQNTGLEFYVHYPRPTMTDNQGYINFLMYSESRGYYVNTIFWNMFVLSNSNTYLPSTARITINDNSWNFGGDTFPEVYTGAYYSLYMFNADGHCWHLKSSSTSNLESHTQTIGGVIVGYQAFGSVHVVDNLTKNNTVFTVCYSEDGSSKLLFDIIDLLNANYSQNTAILDKVHAILNSVDNVKYQLEEVVDYLQSIDKQLESINYKLNAIYDKAEELLEEEKEQTSWLGRIWESIQNFFKPGDNDKETTDNLKENSDKQSETINNLNEKGKTEKVDVDSASGSVDAYIDGNAIQNYGVLLSVFTNHEYILKSILVVLAIGLVAYVLFGKKR